MPTAVLDRSPKFIPFSEQDVDAQLLVHKRSLPTASARLSVCVTLYNETQEFVAATLSAIEESIEHQCSAGPIHELIVAIIVDGIDNLAPCSRAYLTRHGYLLEGSANGEDFCLHWTQRDVGAFGAEHRVRVHQMVLTKRLNQGKLHSHWCYYHFVQWLAPAPLCTQMDVGTCPEREALARMWQTFAANPSLGALAAKTLVPKPQSSWDVLAVFQYASFLDERYLHWPKEQLTGYLTVLPGQLHMLRWRAVAGPSAANMDNASFTRRLQFADTCPVLLDYLSGISPTSAVAALAFLAEDRVLGLSLDAAEEGRWSLGYQPTARAATDACSSWLELLRQRRRWLCGGSACLARLALSPRSVAARAHGAWLLLGTLLGPVCGLFTVYALLAAVAEALQADSTKVFDALPLHETGSFGLAQLPGFVSSGLALLLIGWALLAHGRASGRRLTLLARFCIGLGSFCWASTLVAYVLFSPFSLCKALTLGGLVGSAALSSLIVYLYDARDGCGRLRVLPVYALTRHVVRTLLLTYALANVQDLSWGTKGLRNSSPPLQRSARRLSHHVVGVVVSVYSVFIAALIAMPTGWTQVWLPSVASLLLLDRLISFVAHLKLFRLGSKALPDRLDLSTLEVRG